MPKVKVRISCDYTDYLDVEIRAEEDVAVALTAVVTQLLAEASNELTAPTSDKE